MAQLNGVHHLALMTADVKGQIEFFSDVLGMKLKALYWMHNVDGYFHAFMELNANSSVAFVFAPAVKEIPTEFGVSHAGNPVKPCAAGNMQHVAFSVDTVDELLAMRDRIRSRGVRVLGPLDHGFCQSIYFGGPENLVLEVSTSAEAIDAEGFMHTGDVAVMDDEGYVNIRGRTKDMIIRGGENISPREIEEFLHTHPDVADVQVVGVPDPKFGEQVMAWVQLREGAQLEPQALRDFCRGELSHFKIPQYVRFTKEFPLTVTGKIQKFRLRELAVEELDLKGVGETA